MYAVRTEHLPIAYHTADMNITNVVKVLNLLEITRIGHEPNMPNVLRFLSKDSCVTEHWYQSVSGVSNYCSINTRQQTECNITAISENIISIDIFFLTSTSSHVQPCPAMSSHVQPSSPTVATTSSNEVASKYRPCWGQLRSVGATCVSTSRKQSTQHHFMRSITSAGSPCGWKTTMLQKNNCFTEGFIFRMILKILKGWPWLICRESCKQQTPLAASWCCEPAGLQAAPCFQPNPPKRWWSAGRPKTWNHHPNCAAATGTSGIPHPKSDVLYPVGPLMPILSYLAKNSGCSFQWFKWLVSEISYESVAFYCATPKWFSIHQLFFPLLRHLCCQFPGLSWSGGQGAW